MIRTWLFILIQLSTFGLLQAEVAVVCGTITGQEANVYISFRQDLVTETEVKFPIRIDEEGHFKISFDLVSSIPGYIHVDDAVFPIFLHSPDSLVVTLSNNSGWWQIGYSGKYRVENEYLQQLQKNKRTEKEIIYEMGKRTFESFETWLNEQFSRHYSEYIHLRSQNKISLEFEQFANAELVYDRAYYLLRYRIEHPLANEMTPPMKLPAGYFGFLKAILINNNDALISPAYQNFLKEFNSFCNEHIGDQQIASTIEQNFVVTSKTTPLFAKPDVPPIYSILKRGDLLKFTGLRSDFKSKSQIGGEIAEDYWYKVIASSGREGWVLGHTIEKIIRDTIDLSQPIRKETAVMSKMVSKGIVRFEELLVFNDPNDKKVIATLPFGFEMNYPHVTTSEATTYEYDGITYLGKYVMIEWSGKVGWVFEGGIQVTSELQKSYEERRIVTLGAFEDYAAYNAFLYDRALYLSIAKDLLLRLQLDQDDRLPDDISNFLAFSTDQLINDVVQSQFQSTYNTVVNSGTNASSVHLVQLSSAYLEDYSQGEVTSTRVLNTDIELRENYVVLPGIRNSTRISSRININSPDLEFSVISDPLKETRTYLTNRSIQSEKHIIFDQEKDQFGYIQSKSDLIPFYLEAGKDLSFDTHAQKRISSDDVDNQFLIDLYYAFIEDHELLESSRTMDEQTFKTKVSGLIQKKLFYVNQIGKERGISGKVISAITQDIYYWKGVQMFKYFLEHPGFDKSWKIPGQEDDFFDFLEMIDVNPIDAVLGSNYRNFVRQYFNYLGQQEANRMLNADDLLEKYFNGYSYFFLKADQLFIEVMTQDAIMIGKEIARFIQICPYNELNESLRNHYNANLPLVAGIDAPHFELIDAQGRSWSKTDLIGKIVILDFWATWCGPCLEKMRSDQTLWTHYNREDVEFVYVSLDKSKESWELFLGNNANIKGIHLFPKKSPGFDADIAQAYKIASLPNFYIIGRDGRLAYSSFTTLSPNRIKDYIDNLIYPK